MRVKVYYMQSLNSRIKDGSFLFVSKEFGILEYINREEKNVRRVKPDFRYSNFNEFYELFTSKDRFNRHNELINLGWL